MYRMHQYAQELKLKRLMQEVSVVQGDIERITEGREGKKEKEREERDRQYIIIIKIWLLSLLLL